MARKLLLIFASLTLCIAGAALYLSITSTQASSATTSTVLVAKGDLPPGTTAASLTDAHLESKQIAEGALPPNALKSLAEVRDQKTIVPIFAGQPLTARQFAANSSTGGLPVPDGTNAISAEIVDDQRVAGFVQPGSRVQVYVRGTDSAGVPTATVLLPAAPVIAVGPVTPTGEGDGAASNEKVAKTIVTFALNTDDSKKLIAATGYGKDAIYLGLLPN